MSEIVEQTKIISEEEAQKIADDFKKIDSKIKGNCFEELLDNIDQHRNIP